MVKKKNILFIVTVLVLLSGCFEFRIPDIPERIVPPKINTGPYQFYLTSMSVNFDTLLTYLGDDLSLDEYREAYPGDPGGNTDWFVMRDTFTTDFDLDMSMKAEPVSSSIERSMTFVEFSTRTFNTPSISLVDIYPAITSLPEGTTTPPLEDIAFPPDTSYINFPMDRQRFSSGTMTVTITNDLVCTLGDPVTIAVYDSITHSPIYNDASEHVKLQWDQPISPGGEVTENISLAGAEFPKAVMIIVSGVICGDGPETITNNAAARNSSFTVTGQMVSMVGEYVQGDLDPELISDTSHISFGNELSDAEISVDRAYLDTSHIEITLSNTSSITGKVLLNMMSLDTSAAAGLQYFSTDSMVIPAGGSNTYNFPLNNASVLLGDDFEYRTYIRIPGQYGELYDTDEFAVTFDFYGETAGDSIGVESVDATFNQAKYEFEEVGLDMNMGDMFPEEFDNIELSDIDLELDIDTDFDIPVYVDLKLVGAKNDGADTVQLTVSQQIAGTGGNSRIVFNNAERLVNFRPDSLSISGSVRLNGSGNIPLAQTIDVEGRVGVPFEFEITEPLSFSPEYSSLNLESLPSFLNDFTGTLQAMVNNSFQFGVGVTVSAARDTNYFTDPAYGDSVRQLADIAIPAMDSVTQEIVLTKEDYDFIAAAVDSTWIAMDIQLSGRDDQQPTTFLSTDSVSLRLNIQAEGTLDLSKFAADTSNTGGGAE